MFKNKKIKIIITVFLLAFMLTFTFPSIAFADQTSDVSSFVTRLYQTCLDRGPDPAGLDNWISNLISGKVTGGQAAYGFVFSEELKNRNLNNDQFLAIMYRAFFDRPADIGGYNNWMGLLNGGSSREFVFSNFVNSTEFANICATYGIQAGTVTATTTTTVSNNSNSVLSQIRAKAIQDWPNDPEMQNYQYKNQVNAYNLVCLLPSSSNYHPEILAKSQSDWPNDYEMQLYQYNNQLNSFNAIQSIINSGNYNVSAMNRVKNEWPNDYEMQLYCYQNGL